jgi:1-acyl-sn-glycerol-3-phosphate acyltransferase
MTQFFLYFYYFFSKKRGLLWIGLFALALGLGAMALQLKMVEDISRMVPKGLKIGNSYKVLENSKSLEKLLVSISLRDTSASSSLLMELADSLTRRLEKDTVAKKRIQEIRVKMPENLIQNAYGFFHEHVPLFLNEGDYVRLQTKLAPSNIQQTLENGLKWMSLPSSGMMRQYFVSDPLFFTPLALEKLSSLQMDSNYTIENGYLVTRDGKNLLLIIQPAYPTNQIGENSLLLEHLDQIIDTLEHQFQSKAEVEYFGGTAVAVCNSKQIKKDINLTLSLSLLLISLTIWGYYRQLRVTLALLVPVVFGMLFAAAAVWVVNGQISAIAMASGAVVVGIIIDYSTHFFSHYKHTGSISQTIKDITLPLLIGNVSTVGAFFSLMWVDSQVLSDFGLFAGFSLLGGVLFTLLILPHLSPTPKTPLKQTLFAKWMDKIGQYKPEENKWLVRISLILTITFFFLYNKVEFEQDFGALNFMTEDLIRAEEHLYKKDAESERTIFLMFEGGTLEEAIRSTEKGIHLAEQLQDSAKIASIANPVSLLPSQAQQKLKIARWEKFWTSDRIDSLQKNLHIAAQSLGIRPETFAPFLESLKKSPSTLSTSDIDFVRTHFLYDFVTEKKGEYSILSSIKVPVASAMEVNQSLSDQSAALVLDKQYLASKLLNGVKDNFNQILAMTSILVFCVLLISYGRIELALITFLPMIVSWLWILGIMALLGIKFNIVNIIISTFIFGLGDDFSIFIMDGLQKEYSQGKSDLDSFKTAIFISMLTTLLGVGVLIFALHPALNSIAVISVIGILCAMGIAFLFIPLLFRSLVSNRATKGLPPITLFAFIRSLFAFTYFLLGCILLTIIGFLIFKVLRLNTPRVRYFYHVLLMLCSKSIMRIMYMVRIKIENTSHENFKKPAVIVANHQSFLDILALLMLYPKLIFFTNNWVWNSPFFGAAVQMAEFYSVDDGVENSLELVKRKVEEGYSVVIFPEGARSRDGVLKRFHKGAFYLAEHFGLDIIPVVLHGTGHGMVKNDFLLNKGVITIKILPRLLPDGTSYQERSKATSKLIRHEYEALNTPDFFKFRIIQNYILKGPILEWYMRIKITLEKNYVLFDQHLPQQGLIYDLGCGYGFMSHLLSWTKPKRQLIGLDYDEEKIDTAKHVIKYGENFPNFFHGDVTQFDLTPCEGIVLADVLHYLTKENQWKVLDNCLSALKDGGILLLRDGDRSDQAHHGRTKWTEIFSTKWFGFNKTTPSGLEFVSLHEISDYIRSKNNFSIETIEKSAITSNTVLKIGRITADTI